MFRSPAFVRSSLAPLAVALLGLILGAATAATLGCQGRAPAPGDRADAAPVASSRTAEADAPAAPAAEPDGTENGNDQPGFFSRVFHREPVRLEVPAGTPLTLRLADQISSQTSQPGESFRATVARPVSVGGQVAIPAGASVLGRVTEVRPLRKVGGQAHLAVHFDSVELPSGASAPISAGFSRTGKSETPKDAATIAGGALAGAILGHQVEDGNKGKVVGGLVGAGVGTAIAANTKGETITLPAGATLTVTLQAPTTVELPS